MAQARWIVSAAFAGVSVLAGSSIITVVQRPTWRINISSGVVKKSAPAMAPQCARRNVCHDVGRSGTGGMPCALRIRAIVDRPTRCPTFFRAPPIRV
jgi:hypothetical protein